MRVSATSKYLRHSTRKTRLVTRAIVGLPLEQASAMLRFMPQGAARDVAKVLNSAAANAEHNQDRARDDLFVVQATAAPGGRKTPQPGRASPCAWVRPRPTGGRP